MKLSGKDTVYRGHEGVRQLMRDIDDTLAEIHVEFSDVRDLGDQVLAVGRLHTRGKASGVASEAPSDTWLSSETESLSVCGPISTRVKPSKPPGLRSRR